LKIKPLHIRLTEELLVEVDAERRAELLARSAAHLARIGEFEEAEKRIADLRKVYADGRSGRATVWMMLAEGLVHLFKEENLLALDRITRAQVLGTAMRYPAIVALASAWKSHIEQSRSEFPKMTESLRIALQNASDDDLDAQTRLGLVLFNSFMICGDRTQAQKWFMRTHDRAVRNGDQASIEALFYNRATLGLAYLRAERCFHETETQSLSTARLEMQSVRNLQPLLLGAIFPNYVELWFARLLVVEGRFAEAVEGLKSAKKMTRLAQVTTDGKFMELEIAFCMFNADNRIGALSIVHSMEREDFASLHVDDRLVAEWMRWQMMLSDPQFGDFQHQTHLLNTLRDEYASSKELVSLAIAEFKLQ
jgi:TPR repeat protein